MTTTPTPASQPSPAPTSMDKRMESLAQANAQLEAVRANREERMRRLDLTDHSARVVQTNTAAIPKRAWSKEAEMVESWAAGALSDDATSLLAAKKAHQAIVDEKKKMEDAYIESSRLHELYWEIKGAERIVAAIEAHNREQKS